MNAKQLAAWDKKTYPTTPKGIVARLNERFKRLTFAAAGGELRVLHPPSTLIPITAPDLWTPEYTDKIETLIKADLGDRLKVFACIRFGGQVIRPVE